MEAIDPFVFRLSIFVLAIFVGYFVVWSVTPALHTPLMSVTNAISSVIVVGALIAVSVSTHPSDPIVAVASPIGHPASPETVTAIQDYVIGQTHSTAVRAAWESKILGFVALILASVNIFGGFLVTARMLAMYKKKEK
jgi:NAD(P) transhydrogenase subunit alpha